MAERKMVKGSVMVDFVKLIRATKHVPWEEHLTDEDMELVNTMVIPSNWYPVETYQRIGLAIWKLVAKENIDVARSFGQQAMQKLLDGPYKPMLRQDDPHRAMQKFLDLRKSLFNFSEFKLDKITERSMRIMISEIMGYEGLEIFNILVGAHFETLIEANGGKDVTMQVKEITENQEPKLVFEISWDTQSK